MTDAGVGANAAVTTNDDAFTDRRQCSDATARADLGPCLDYRVGANLG
jgi:hypothetical protein